MRPFRMMLFLLALAAAPVQALDPVESGRLRALVDAARESNSSALLVMQDGKVVLEEYFDQPREPIEAMSVTKSVMNLAIGHLLQEGRIESLDTPLHTWFPEWKQGRKQQVTLRHIMSHTSGLQNVPNTGVEIYPSPDFVQLALAAELDSPPGGAWAYNNKALNLVPEIVRRVTGERIDAWLRTGLFAQLGITDFTWSLDDAGHPHGMSGLQIHPRDLARLGQLMLQGGVWDGRALLPPDWVEVSTTRPDVAPNGVGLLWFVTPRAWRHTIDAAQLDALVEKGADAAYLARLRPHYGTYEGEEWSGLLRRVYGEDYSDAARAAIRPASDAGMTLSRREAVGMKGYSGRGYLGQYLVVYPEHALVAVRMIRFDRYDQTSTRDEFGRFEPMVYALFDPAPETLPAR